MEYLIVLKEWPLYLFVKPASLILIAVCSNAPPKNNKGVLKSSQRSSAAGNDYDRIGPPALLPGLSEKLIQHLIGIMQRTQILIFIHTTGEKRASRYFHVLLTAQMKPGGEKGSLGLLQISL